MRLAAQLGISDEVGPKLQRLPGGGPMAALQSGETEVAALPLTNIAPVEGVHARAICPSISKTDIPLAFCLNSDAREHTTALARWLTSPERTELLRRLGVHR